MIEWLFPRRHERPQDPGDDPEAQEREAVRQAGRDAVAEVREFIRSHTGTDRTGLGR